MLFMLWLFASAAVAQVSPALWNAAQLGATQRQVETQLSEAGLAPKTVQWDEPGGLAAGTLDRPGLLAMLNHHKVRNRMMEGLPEKGPSFVLVADDSATVAYAFINNRLWAAAFGLSPDALKPLPDPFEPNRLIGLTATKSAIRARCGGLTVSRRDAYGNAREWRNPCRGGTAFAQYAPETDTPMTILLVRSER